MFLPDPVAALSEMARVARPGATVAAVVPASLASSPGYSRFAEVVARHADTVLLIDRTLKAMGPPSRVLRSDQLDRVYDFPHGHVHPPAPDTGGSR